MKINLLLLLSLKTKLLQNITNQDKKGVVK